MTGLRVATPWRGAAGLMLIFALTSVYHYLYIVRLQKYLGPAGAKAARCANCGYDCGAVAGREPGFVFRCPECGFRWSIEEYLYARLGIGDRLKAPPPPPVSPRFEG